jgi:hypothetical protein
VSYHPVAIVWPCPVSVEVYVLAGRSVVVPRAVCPACFVPMVFWSGYERSVRVAGRCWRLWLARGRCSGCRVSHVLLPSFLVIGRLDVAATIGLVLGGVGGRSGARRVAVLVDVPHTTARGWVRSFRSRASLLWSGFVALTVELGGEIPAVIPVDVGAATVVAMQCAHRAGVERHWLLTPGLWDFVSVVCGGLLIRSNTDPPWRVFGGRCFIPPVPFSGMSS